jgi:anti-sigma-K factor RskA
MKTNRQELLLSRYLDGDLTPREREAMETRLAESGELQGLKADFEAVGQTLRAWPTPAGPTPEAAWADVQRRLRLEREEQAGEAETGFWGSRLAWASAMMTVVLVALGVWIAANRPGMPALAATEPAEVEWVETDLPGAMTMVYQDDDTGLTVIWVQEDENGEPANVES